MASGKAEKGAKSPVASSKDAADDLLLPLPPSDPNQEVDQRYVKAFQREVGLSARLFLRIEAIGLALASDWRADCERRNARFLWVAIFMAFGAGLYYTLPDEPSLALISAGLILFFGWLWRRARSGTVDLLLLLVASSVAGLCVASFHGTFRASPVLTHDFSGQVTGLVEHIEFRTRQGKKDERWTIAVEKIDPYDASNVPKRVLLVRKSLGKAFQIGDRISVRARLLPLQQPAYPGAFDYGRYLWARGIGA